jgi:hypothetical protein
VQVSHALAYSRLNIAEAAALLAKQASLTKRAGPGLLDLLRNPTQVVDGKTVPHVPAETLRNALIGLGIGGVAGGVQEYSKPEKERNYSRVIDKAMLGSMLGGSGTVAWRHLVNSGNAKAPAVLQPEFDGMGASPSPIDQVRENLSADNEAAAAPSAPTARSPLADLAAGAAADKKLPLSVRNTAMWAHDAGPAQWGGALGGGAVGYGLGARAGQIGRLLNNSGKPVAPAGKGRIAASMLAKILGGVGGTYVGGSLSSSLLPGGAK